MATFDDDVDVPFEEMEGSPVESNTESGFTATMTLQCDWDDRWDLMTQLLANDAGQLIYPHQPDFNAYAQTASAKGVGQVTGTGMNSVVIYEKALITVNFATQGAGGQGEPDGDGNLIAESLEPYIENLPMPTIKPNGKPAFLWWDGSTKEVVAPEEAPVRQIRGCYYILKRFNRVTIPTAALSLMGTVNNNTVTSVSLGVSFEPETLLFTPPTLERTTSKTGDLGWTESYRFNYRPNFDPDTGIANGWNRFWKASAGTYWDMYYVDDDGVPTERVLIYPTGNFALL
jgi:hypothetical protein